MKQKHFYSHIVEIESIHIALKDLGLEENERTELITLAESSIHHVVLDTVLSELNNDDKKTFLAHIAEEKQEDIWKLLKEKINDVEDKIRTAAKKLIDELHQDIKTARTKK